MAKQLSPPQIHTRKVKVLQVSAPVFEEMWRTGNKIEAEIVEGLPEDATMLGINYDSLNNVAKLLFTSKEFPDVKDGDVIPYLDVSVRTIPKT